jgi:hypothetical protein
MEAPMWGVSSIFLSGLAAFLGLLGIVIAGKAVDAGMQIFGGGLLAFAVIYLVGEIRRAYPHK